jgi:phage-related protein
MRQSYTAFKFGTQVFHENITNHKLLNATLSDEFYSDCIRGSRNILEETIPGRDIPYFYEIDDEPLEFEVTFAFAESMTKSQIKTIVRKLITTKRYEELTFGKYSGSTYTAETPIYKVIFIGEVDINYVSTGFDGSNNELFIAYITLTARADRPYGYQSISRSVVNQNNTTINNTGDVEFYPNIVITNTNGGVIQTDKYIRIINTTNNSAITFSSLASGEIVTVNSNLQTITSTGASTPIYPRWQRNDLYLSVGNNTLQFSYSTDGQSSWTNYNMTVQITGEAPVYIYEAE